VAHADDAPCDLLEWDTEFWGTTIGRVRGGRLDSARLADVDGWARAHGVDCLYFLADADDPASAHAAEDGDFRLMDVRVELDRPAEAADLPEGVREAGASDREPLQAIAAASHGATRFYADPRFPDERCDDLYETWITRSLDGWAAGVLVAESDGRQAGYVSCHLDDGTGSIGLIAVDANTRRSGLGVALSLGAVAWCAARGADRMTVVTQGRNVAALRTFGRAGFLVSQLGLWFHKWYA
jgi:dTDP-4-amino-4,6-dideoxy-D-galactose acyltransferase